MRRLEIVDAEKQFVHERIRQAKRYVGSAKRDLDAGDLEPAFTSAYDAARFAVDAHMQANGLRAGNVQGAHRAVVDYVAERIQVPSTPDIAAQFDAMRDVRNLIEYPTSAVASVPTDDVVRAITLAEALIDAAERG